MTYEAGGSPRDAALSAGDVGAEAVIRAGGTTTEVNRHHHFIQHSPFKSPPDPSLQAASGASEAVKFIGADVSLAALCAGRVAARITCRKEAADQANMAAAAAAAAAAAVRGLGYSSLLVTEAAVREAALWELQLGGDASSAALVAALAGMEAGAEEEVAWETAGVAVAGLLLEQGGNPDAAISGVAESMAHYDGDAVVMANVKGLVTGEVALSQGKALEEAIVAVGVVVRDGGGPRENVLDIGARTAASQTLLEGGQTSPIRSLSVCLFICLSSPSVHVPYKSNEMYPISQ